MSFSIGIVGLPNVGKSTLFKALTKKEVDISNYPFCTIKPNQGVVAVPDPRLEKTSQIVKPLKTTPTIIKFVDIAGLVKNAHQGEGLGNQFLSHIREVDLILHLVRAFEDLNVSHPEKTIEPKRDIEIVETELILKDLETIEKRLAETKKQAKSSEKQLLEELSILERLRIFLDKGQPARNFVTEPQERLSQLLKELSLLTAKPVIYIFNINSSQSLEKIIPPWRPTPSSTRTYLGKEYEESPSLSQEWSSKKTLFIDSKLEKEIGELNSEEIEELQLKSNLDQIIQACYNTLNLLTFYTITGGKEVRAWTLRQGSSALEAASLVHTDFAEKFIKALVINFKDFLRVGSWHQAQEKGWLKTKGKEYLVKDGDIIEFKI